jgi:hypothetical protein
VPPRDGPPLEHDPYPGGVLTLIGALSAPVDLTTYTPRLGRPLDRDALHSRRAWRLAYHSQRLAPLERGQRTAERRASRIRRRLGGTASGGVYADLPPRPRGMWRKTYVRLRREIIEAEREVERAFLAGAAAIVERADRAGSGRRGP